MAGLRPVAALACWLALASACVGNMRCLHHRGADDCPQGGSPVFREHLYENRTDAMYMFTLESPVYRCHFLKTSIYLDFLNVSKEDCVDDVEDNFDLVDIGGMSFIDSYENCSQIYMEFCFKCLYSGCYKIYIDQTAGSGMSAEKHTLLRQIMWLQNNYTQNDFLFKTPKMEEILDGMYHKVFVEFKEDYLTESTEHYRFTLQHINSSSWIDATDCTNTTTKITCTLKDMFPGEYYGNIRIFHPRCSSIYGVCSWNKKIVRNVVADSLIYNIPIFPEKYWYEKYFTIIIVLGLCMTSLVGWIFFKKKTSKKIAAQQTYDNALCNSVNCHVSELETVTGIYLIYARDCLPFMRVMENFRKLLRKMTGCKVYDVFDDDLFCEIAMSPNEWVMSHLQDPNIRVVLVATECANRLYKNLLYYHTQKTNPDEHYYRDVYLQPIYCDSVVTYSLKLISFDVNPFPYHKIFVVRFPKFNKESDYMTHVNPFKRFDMPENLGALVKNIFHQGTLGKFDYDSDSESPCETFRKYAHITEESFIECIKELNDFFKDNSTYLMENIMINQADISPTDNCTTLLTRSQSNVV